MQLSIIIPAKNEAASIGEVVGKIRSDFPKAAGRARRGLRHGRRRAHPVLSYFLLQRSTSSANQYLISDW